MSALFLVISLLILMALCIRGVPIFIATFISGVVLVSTAGLNPVTAMLKTYSPGLGGYFGDFFFIFVFGALFGKLTDISGAADSIANFIVTKLGEKAVVPALMVACAVLCFGGVSVFVALFTVYSMMISMFRKANITRKMIPLVYFGGAGTFAMILPGSPQIQNLIPMKSLGTSTTAGLVPGIIAAAFEAVLVFGYVMWCARNYRSKGIGFEERDSENASARHSDQKLPNPLVAILPMIVLLVSLNVLKLEPALALFVGIVSALLFYSPFIDWKTLVKKLGAGTLEGTGSLFNTSAVVGFGYLIKSVPIFGTLIKTITSTGVNPLVASGAGVAGLVFISGSGSGALSILMPILAKIYIPMGVNAAALHRVATTACFCTPMFNGLVVTVLSVCGLTHKDVTIPLGVVSTLIPMITLSLLLGLYMTHLF
jgi:H+/gluconate symporter-like permease